MKEKLTSEGLTIKSEGTIKSTVIDARPNASSWKVGGQAPPMSSDLEGHIFCLLVNVTPPVGQVIYGNEL